MSDWKLGGILWKATIWCLNISFKYKHSNGKFRIASRSSSS